MLNRHDVRRRLAGFYLLTAWIGVTINFFLPRLMPANPLDLMLTRYRSETKPVQVHSLEVTLDVDGDRGSFARYSHYLTQRLRGPWWSPSAVSPRRSSP